LVVTKLKLQATCKHAKKYCTELSVRKLPRGS